MKTMQVLRNIRRWLRRLSICYMLGFASAMDQDTKLMDADFNKIEQQGPERKE